MVTFNKEHDRPGRRAEPCCDVATREPTKVKIEHRGETVHEFETAYAMVLRHHDDHVCGAVRIGCRTEMMDLLYAALHLAEEHIGAGSVAVVLAEYVDRRFGGNGGA